MKLWGGFQGMPPFRVGEIEAEYIVEGDPREARLSVFRRMVEAKLNREKVAHKLARGDGWTLAPWWSYPPRLADEALRAEAAIWGRDGRVVGVCRMVWPSEEVRSEA